MNGHQLIELGWPAGPLIGKALREAGNMFAAGRSEDEVSRTLADLLLSPESFLENDLGALAREIIRQRRTPVTPDVRPEPTGYRVWGRHLIDDGAVRQFEGCMRLPVAVAGALMPDAHIGYGIPIGGVVALENAVSPAMVGVDIACRMMMTAYELDPQEELAEDRRERIREVMRSSTRFGLGSCYRTEERQDHEVMDDPAWRELPMLRLLKDRAWSQLGTSGSGNHFLDAGEMHLRGTRISWLTFISHSGSRALGMAIANHYSKIAQELCLLPDELRDLAWLPLNRAEGEEYWLAMNFAGRYASANHHIIHDKIAAALGMQPALTVENHHNFAWIELHEGRDVIVHRKGATPAHQGTMGIIPGSMGSESLLVKGLGNEASLASASHGAGRQMSRRKAKQTINRSDLERRLAQSNVELLSGGLDEAPQAYKSINEVMLCQSDLVEVVGTFHPAIVLMSDDGLAED